MRIQYLGKITEAYQWWRNGDHPNDNCTVYKGEDGLQFWGSGNVVQYYRYPNTPSAKRCTTCGYQMHIHGWIEGENKAVCPGDWIIKNKNNYKSYNKGFLSEADDLDKRITHDQD